MIESVRTYDPFKSDFYIFLFLAHPIRHLIRNQMSQKQKIAEKWS